ncbi:hypothetical protein PIB30_038144 [Stylosanthes scabra]|uniref:PB1-like domain-containing protein n=1 Tax=Stylosanthes scabra TaxID=79078 RepID=A0ABU6WC16_9FABA|nr:hypothetical protein [Stylosanthes scabra]
MATFVVPVLNVGGKLGPDENGILKYIDGQVQTFDAVDVDMICIPDLEGMAKSLGYPKFSTEELQAPTSTPALAPGSSGTPPPNPLPLRFRPKQPIVRPPTTPSVNVDPQEPQTGFTFMPTLGFSLLERFRALTKIMQFKLVF